MGESVKALLLEGIHPVAKQQLESHGYQVTLLPNSPKEAELATLLKDVHLLGIRSKTQVTQGLLEKAPSLVAVGAFCIGTNQVDLDAAMRRGVCVFNAPFSNTRSVAELVMAEIVMLSRHLGDRSMEMHQGRWRKVASGSHEVRGKTLGVVGYGHIGTQIGILAEFFGMRVIFHDVATKLPLGNAQPTDSLNEVLAESDFVTLHVPETPQTKGMIGEAELKVMKAGSCLINASRGTVVDLNALANALKSKHLAGAALDVYPDEPENNSFDGFKSPVQGLENVVLTPHVGGSTLEAQESIGREVATSFSRYLQTGATVGAVNFPQLELPPTPKTHRLLHVHKNVPGVLRDVNKIVSELSANVQAQVLSTFGEIGYLIVDLDLPVTNDVCQKLKGLATTLQARSLS